MSRLRTNRGDALVAALKLGCLLELNKEEDIECLRFILEQSEEAEDAKVIALRVLALQGSANDQKLAKVSSPARTDFQCAPPPHHKSSAKQRKAAASRAPTRLAVEILSLALNILLSTTRLHWIFWGRNRRLWKD